MCAERFIPLTALLFISVALPAVRCEYDPLSSSWDVCCLSASLAQLMITKLWSDCLWGSEFTAQEVGLLTSSPSLSQRPADSLGSVFSEDEELTEDMKLLLDQQFIRVAENHMCGSDCCERWCSTEEEVEEVENAEHTSVKDGA
ncbi:plexin A [Sarotherodon galilaeus]